MSQLCEKHLRPFSLWKIFEILKNIEKMKNDFCVFSAPFVLIFTPMIDFDMLNSILQLSQKPQNVT